MRNDIVKIWLIYLYSYVMRVLVFLMSTVWCNGDGSAICVVGIEVDFHPAKIRHNVAKG